MDPIQHYTQTLMKQGKLNTLPEEVRASLSEQLEAQVTQRLGAVIINALPANERDAFVAKLNENLTEVDRTKIMDDAAKLIPDYQKLLEKTLEDLAVEFLSNLSR